MWFMESRNALPSTYLFPDKVRVPTQLRQSLVTAVWREIIIGNFQQRQLADVAKKCLSGTYQLSQEDAVTVINSLLTCRRAQIEHYKSTGVFADMRRLNQAFFELTKAGVLALADYLCNASSASEEAYQEMYRGNFKAVLYFHRQDTERLIASNETLLGFDYNHLHFYTESDYAQLSSSQKKAAFAEHMLDIVESDINPIFSKYNIDLQWDGKVTSRMRIKNVDWLVLLPAE